MLRAMVHRSIATQNEARLTPQFRQEVEIDIGLNVAILSHVPTGKNRASSGFVSNRRSTSFSIQGESTRTVINKL